MKRQKIGRNSEKLMRQKVMLCMTDSLKEGQLFIYDLLCMTASLKEGQLFMTWCALLIAYLKEG